MNHTAMTVIKLQRIDHILLTNVQEIFRLDRGDDDKPIEFERPSGK